MHTTVTMLSITFLLALGVQSRRIFHTSDESLMSTKPVTNRVNATAQNFTEKNLNLPSNNKIITGNRDIENNSNVTLIGTEYNYVDFPNMVFKLFLVKIIEALKTLEFYLSLKPLAVKIPKTYMFFNQTIINKNNTSKSSHSNYSQTDRSLETNTESPFKAMSITTEMPIKKALKTTEVKPTYKPVKIKLDHASLQKKEPNKKSIMNLENTTSDGTSRDLNTKTENLTTNNQLITKEKEKKTPENKVLHVKSMESSTPKITSEQKEQIKDQYEEKPKATAGLFTNVVAAVMYVFKTIGSWFGWK